MSVQSLSICTEDFELFKHSAVYLLYLSKRKISALQTQGTHSVYDEYFVNLFKSLLSFRKPPFTFFTFISHNIGTHSHVNKYTWEPTIL